MRVGRLLLLIGVCFPSLLAAQSSQKTALPEQTAQTPQPAAREQFLSYWTTEPGWNTELLLRNNLESEQLTVVPAVRTSTGIETALPSVTIKPGDVASLDLDNVLINAAPQLLGSWGSLVLRYSSIAHRALYASVMIRGTGRPIVFHLDAFERGSRYETGSREGIWWLPWESTTGYLILTNSGDDSLQPTLTLYDAGGRTAQQSLVIPPRQSQRLSVRDVVEQSGLTGSFGGIQIKMTKGARYLDSVHLLFEASGNFSAVMKMFKHDPAVTLASRSFGGATEWTTRAPMLALSNPDPALRLPAGTVLQPKVFVRNASSNAVTAHIGFNWRSATTNGKSVPFNLPLGPNQTQVVDVADLQAQKLLPADAYWASVILSAPVQPNDLLAVAASYDSTGRYGAQTPFSDQLASHWEGGKWEVDATHDSLVTIGNGGKQAAQAQLTILYNQGAGQYQIERTLAPGEQMALDFAELIRDAVPDKNGNVLPSGLTSGTYRLLDLADNPLGGLYEGKVIVDKTWGHATYTCMICCGPDTPWMTYSPLDLLLNGNFLQSVQAVNSCNGHLSTITSDFPTWWTGNSAIATASGHQINGVGVGSTNHYAQSINMYWGPLEDDPSCPLSQEQPSADTEVKPVISGSNTLWWFKGLGGGVSGYPNQITLTASSGGLGTSFAWAIASGSDKVSLSTSTSATIQVTSKGQSTTANDVGITVTVGGITSDPFKLTIRAPYTLGSSPDHPVPVYSADPTFVWNVQIWYRVLDNFLSPLPNPVPINENWTSAIVHDYLNENWRRGDPGCANLDSTATFFDLIAGETSDHSPAPTYNQQQNGSAVQHWGQEWRLGTCMIGSGPRVQTDTIQKYTDHAAHTGITSPAP